MRLQEYQPRYYSVGLKTWGILTPDAFLSPFLALHTGMWEDGIRNLSYGLNFTTRIPDRFDVVVGLDWADIRTSDGFCLEEDDPIRDANWAQSILSLLSFDVGLHWFTSFGHQNRWQVYGGPNLGMAIVLGEFRKFEIDTDACGWTTIEDRARTDPSLVEACAAAVGQPWRQGRGKAEDRIPPVLPVIGATVGMRYLIGENFSLGLEGGFKTLYFFGGLNAGYFWYSQRR
jgi:hypothetical protein